MLTAEQQTHNYIIIRMTKTSYNRAVANGPVGPAMAGPIIEPVICFKLKKMNLLFNFFSARPIIESVIFSRL